MKKIAVFVSGSGSDLQSIIDGVESGYIEAKIECIIASKTGIFAKTRAEKHKIDYYEFLKKDYATNEDMFVDIIKLLEEKEIDFIVLAGYLSLLSRDIVEKYRNKIINIHPSLIPSFCGKGFYGLKVHEAVINYGSKVSGATVHFVDEGADTGAIIIQECVEVLDSDDASSLQSRILEVEHRILPRAVKLFAEDKLLISGRKVIIKE